MKRPLSLEQAHEAIEELWGRCKTANGIKPSCSKGCSACCYDPNVVSQEEAEHLVDHLPPAAREEVLRRAEIWMARFLKAGLLNNPEPDVMEYRAADLPCPLLKNGLCMLYDQRPANCRLYTAVGKAELCTSDRRRQMFAHSEEVYLATSALLYQDGQRGDHLGVLLYNLLQYSSSGHSVRSAAADWVREKMKPVRDGKVELVYES